MNNEAIQEDNVLNNDGATTADTPTGASETAEAAVEKKYTEEDFNKLKADLESSFNEKITKASEEAAKKATMKPDEKESYEKEQKLLELEEKERDLIQRQLKMDAAEILSKQGMDKEFIDFVMDKDLDSTQLRITKLKELFDSAVHKKVVAGMAGETPSANQGGDRNSSIREQFKKGLGR